MGTLAAAGTSNSKTATEPPDASPSSRNRIASCPILISSLLLVTLSTPPLFCLAYASPAPKLLASLARSICSATTSCHRVSEKTPSRRKYLGFCAPRHKKYYLLLCYRPSHSISLACSRNGCHPRYLRTTHYEGGC